MVARIAGKKRSEAAVGINRLYQPLRSFQVEPQSFFKEWFRRPCRVIYEFLLRNLQSVDHLISRQ